MDKILHIHNTEITQDLPTEIMLLPPSPVIGRDGRSFTYSQNTILEGWAKHGQKIPIDVDHKSEYGISTIAVGWVESIYSYDNSLYAKVEWNEEGQKLVSKKYYRYISPAFYSNEFNEVQYLSSVALTNQPNLKMPSLNKINNQYKKENNKNMDKQLLNKALGVDENSDFTVALNSIMNLKEQKIDLNKFVPKEDYEVVLNSKNELQKKIEDIENNNLKKEAEALIDEAINSGQISTNSKEFYMSLCTNKDGLENVKQHLNSKPKLTDEILSNKPKTNIQNHSLTADEISIGKKMGLSEEDLIKSKEIINKNKGA